MSCLDLEGRRITAFSSLLNFVQSFHPFESQCLQNFNAIKNKLNLFKSILFGKLSTQLSMDNVVCIDNGACSVKIGNTSDVEPL